MVDTLSPCSDSLPMTWHPYEPSVSLLKSSWNDPEDASEKDDPVYLQEDEFEPFLDRTEHDDDSIEEMKVAEEVSLFIYTTTYLVYFVLILFGHLRDFFGKRFKSKEYRYLSEINGYAPLLSDFESFFSRRIYKRIRDCWARVVTFTPGRFIHVLERVSEDQNDSYVYTGKLKKCLNLASYNYLGFAQHQGPCAHAVETAIQQYGITSVSTRCEVGTSALHMELERKVAQFLGTEDALCVSMGFATNSTTLPALVSKGCLLISDELNHSSLVFGARLSQATIQVFKHNDMQSLEKVLRRAIAEGQPRTHRPWKKILVVVEGLYSMEGDLCHLPQLMVLKKKYRFYLFMDEAHSIGAMGPHGKGLCDYFQVDPKKVDILMGTFTKSFGAAGGYIAGSKTLIHSLRTYAHAPIYAEPLPVPVVQQILSVLSILMGENGTLEGIQRITQLRINADYFRRALKERGFLVYGHASPVIPVLIFHPTKLAYFSRACLERGLAVVVVGAPATPLILGRVRFCLSAAHTKQDLDYAIRVIDELGEKMGLKLSRKRLLRS